MSSLQSSAQFSEGAEKLYRLTSTFATIARLYVDSKNQEWNPQDAAITNNITDSAGVPPWGEFDPYLNALGFGPLEGYGTNTTGPVGPSDFRNDAVGDQGMGAGTVSLGDWFSGNQHVMGLLEDDLSYLHQI